MPQFLRAHEMMPYVYNIADVAYPVSIRDQMNRARWIIDKARDQGFFGPNRDGKYRRLLVCGAGASGVTAALHAISLGIDTTLVEKSPITFQRQRLCRSRWIDPVQYDWSADHWTTSVFPHAGPAMPLPWTADRSARLASRWHFRLASARTNPLLKFRQPDHALAPFVLPRDAAGNVRGVEVNFHSGKRETFGMVLWCVGFRDENRSVGPYRGFGFWETDPLERPYWGIASPEMDLRGIVSGGGDGALQDVIRLATGLKSASDVWQAIEAAMPALWAFPKDVLHRLSTAEDQAQRALLWSAPGSIDEHQSLHQLHDAHVQAVRTLTTDPLSGTGLIAATRNLLSNRPHDLRLIHSCTHFARCYGLNHFLVLLFAEVSRLSGRSGTFQIIPGHGVDSVTGHACAGSPWRCHGVRHTVQMRERLSCVNKGPGPLAGTEDADVLVIRHGITPNPAFFATPLAFARQTMPYHLP